MRVSWSGVGDARALGSGPGVARIAIANPGGLTDGPDPTRLDLAFWDVTEVDVIDAVLLRVLGDDPDRCVAVRRRLRGAAGWDWRPPMRADAARIAAFAASLPTDVVRVHVNCEFGRSRSRAVAEWLGRRYGTVPEGDVGGAPNPILARLLARH